MLQVEAIYMVKISIIADFSSLERCSRSRLDAAMRGKSGPLAKIYGVSLRAIRDIWNRNTWLCDTESLWAFEAEHMHACSELGIPSSPYVLSEACTPVLAFARMCSECIATEPERNPTGGMARSNSEHIFSGGVCEQKRTISVDDLLTDFVPTISSEWADPFHEDWPNWQVTIRQVFSFSKCGVYVAFSFSWKFFVFLIKYNLETVKVMP